MSYKKCYPAVRKKRGKERFRIRLPLLTMLCFLVFLSTVGFFWPAGGAWLKRMLPVSALDQFAWEIMNSENILACLSDIVTEFLA